MEFAISKLSSKGQIVIPSSMRADLNAGDEFLLVREDDSIVLKKISSLAEELLDDIKFAKSVEKAWDEIDKGNYTSMTKDAFLKEIKKW